MVRSKQKLKDIKLVITDVDGVLTDAGIYYDKNGEFLKKFNTRDSYGMELLFEQNIKTVMLTRENSEIVKVLNDLASEHIQSVLKTPSQYDEILPSYQSAYNEYNKK